MSPKRRRIATTAYQGEDAYSAKPCLTIAAGGTAPALLMLPDGSTIAGEGVEALKKKGFIRKGAEQKKRQEADDYQGFGWQTPEALSEEQINALEGFYTEEERAELYAYGRVLSLSERREIPGSPAWEQVPDTLDGRDVPAHTHHIPPIKRGRFA